MTHPIAEAAREAYAAGWAASGGPLTPRVAAGCSAAIALAVEHADDPRILEATLDLGKLEGMWALLFQRRGQLTDQYAGSVTDAWRKLIRPRLFRDGLHHLRAELGLTETTDGTQRIRRAALAAARAILAALPATAGWAALRQAIRDALAAGRAEGIVNAVAIAAERAGRVGLDWNIAFDHAYQQLGRLDTLWADADTWLSRLLDRAVADLGRLLADQIEAGATYDEMLTSASQLLDGTDVAAVQFVIDWALTTAADQGALSLYQTEGIQTVDWITAGDGRVCFPAGTPVLTSDGDRPIETLRPGDMVSTPAGPRPVVRVIARPYRGTMVIIQAGRSVVTATAEHPFWTSEGWCPAASLEVGDRLQSAENVLVDVVSIHHLDFGKADHLPPARSELGITPDISFAGTGVPVQAVSFERYRQIRNSKVNGPTSDFAFLDEGETEPFECFANSGFEAIFAAEPSIAGNGTELPFPDLVGSDSLGRTAGSAGHMLRRTAARLGAEVPVEVLLGSESIAAPLAVDVLGIDRLAGARADLVAGRDACLDGEVLVANGAALRDLIGAASLVASPRAVGAGRIPPAAGVEGTAAVSAGALGVDDGRTVIAPLRAEGPIGLQAGWAHEAFAALMADVLEGQGLGLSRSRVTSGDSVQVYDIEVSDEHVFYASGLLVHNCSICEYAEDHSPWPINSVPTAPAHPLCRCVLAADMNLDRYATWFTT